MSRKYSPKCGSENVKKTEKEIRNKDTNATTADIVTKTIAGLN